jgi:hypothetical protein
MILLQHLLTEISLSNVQPYQTQFVWRPIGGSSRFAYRGEYEDMDTWNCELDCDGVRVLANMMYSDIVPMPNSPVPAEGSWDFSFFVRAREGVGWTVAQNHGVARGQVNTLRLFKTIGLALRAFIDTHPNVDIINITGSDRTDAKGAQKSRVYAGFLASNPELADFRVQSFGISNHIYMIRRNPQQPKPDASGIDTPGDPNM